MSPLRRLGALLVPCAALSLLVSCSSTNASEGTAEAEISVPSGGATLDVSTETIVWPLARYAISVAEFDTLYYAQDLLTRDCARTKGVELPVVPRGVTVPGTDLRGSIPGGGRENRLWGIWNPEWASKWGYAPPPSSPQSEALQALNARQSSPHDDAVRGECFGGDDVQSFDEAVESATMSDTVVRRGFGIAAGQAEKDSRSHKALADWVACMKGAGASVEGDGSDVLFPGREFESGDEEGIARALIDVGCKQEVSLIQRLADIEAAYQRQYIQKHEAALAAERAKTEEFVNRAKAIAERG